MITQPLHPTAYFLSVVLVVTSAGLPGCGNHERSEPVKTSHTDHAVTDSGKKTPVEQHEHDGGRAESMLMVVAEPATIKPGEPVKLHLMIHDPTGAMIKDFEIIHEKMVHLIIVRDGLDQFAHIHPDVDRSGTSPLRSLFRPRENIVSTPITSPRERTRRRRLP